MLIDVREIGHSILGPPIHSQLVVSPIKAPIQDLLCLIQRRCPHPDSDGASLEIGVEILAFNQ